MPPARMLLVDDEPTILISMREVFSTHGFLVDTADELQPALELIEKQIYQVVIADLRLSGIESREGLEIARTARFASHLTKIIILSAHVSPELERDAMNAGVDLVLRKPQPLAEIARLLRKMLAA